MSCVKCCAYQDYGKLSLGGLVFGIAAAFSTFEFKVVVTDHDSQVAVQFGFTQDLASTIFSYETNRFELTEKLINENLIIDNDLVPSCIVVIFPLKYSFTGFQNVFTKQLYLSWTRLVDSIVHTHGYCLDETTKLVIKLLIISFYIILLVNRTHSSFFENKSYLSNVYIIKA